MAIHVFGVRHHGPGSARSLLQALEALEPDIVLVEGPPDAQDVLPLIVDAAMSPPVALLIYVPNEPRRAAFYPFAHFSPEWQALRYAFGHQIPARFIDLPQAIRLASEVEDDATAPEGAALPDGAAVPDGEAVPEAEAPPDPEAQLRDDPIGMLAEAAGYSDHELWWEHQIEQRQDATGLFVGIMEAMTHLRATAPEPSLYEAQREAHMRQSIRTAVKEGFDRIAVVCGAWHAPVLAEPGPARPDAALLAGLRRVKVEATWVPWTNSRLAYRSGYGAGVGAPGWYAHLWTARDRAAIRWVSHAARLLRDEDLPAASSNVIEAVRLADALAALRDLPMPGLAELNESILTVLCGGETAPMQLIRERLEIGEQLGEIPPETPAVPLQQDLIVWQRRVRLKPSAEIATLDLDLRNDNDLSRSHLLHRLQVLDVPWGKPQEVRGKSGTFHEIWTTEWKPEYALSLIEAGTWGTTIADAAAARLRHEGDTAPDLPRLTTLLDVSILAALPDAVGHLLRCVQDQAVLAADVRHLLDALPPLARVARYGDIRETRAAEIMPVIDALFERIVVGLSGACTSLDDEAAAEMAQSIGNAHESVALLDRPEQQREWQDTLRGVMDYSAIHGLVRGWCCRLLLDLGVLDAEELQRRARLELSPVTPANEAAAWVEGVLRGSGLTLLHQRGLWVALDGWLAGLTSDAFVAIMPLVRRAFSEFQAAERRAMGETVKRLTGDGNDQSFADEAGERPIDRTRAELVIPVLKRILGQGKS